MREGAGRVESGRIGVQRHHALAERIGAGRLSLERLGLSEVGLLGVESGRLWLLHLLLLRRALDLLTECAGRLLCEWPSLCLTSETAISSHVPKRHSPRHLRLHEALRLLLRETAVSGHLRLHEARWLRHHHRLSEGVEGGTAHLHLALLLLLEPDYQSHSYPR